MRDTLGFLKKSEMEKKKNADMKKRKELETAEEYKSLSELQYNLAGYNKSKTRFNYD